MESTEGDERCWSRWAARHGDASFELHRTQRRRAADVIQECLPALTIKPSAANIVELDMFTAEEQCGGGAYPGLRELLAAFPPCQWAVVTSASESMMRSHHAAASLPTPAGSCRRLRPQRRAVCVRLHPWSGVAHPSVRRNAWRSKPRLQVSGQGSWPDARYWRLRVHPTPAT